ncbi:hypothetical protein ENBRE01_0530 [Enteropsectra breve]|nr:hypothetical protein ENBRE01_0530 [Enteropsectra breve]
MIASYIKLTCLLLLALAQKTTPAKHFKYRMERFNPEVSKLEFEVCPSGENNTLVAVVSKVLSLDKFSSYKILGNINEKETVYYPELPSEGKMADHRISFVLLQNGSIVDVLPTKYINGEYVILDKSTSTGIDNALYEDLQHLLDREEPYRDRLHKIEKKFREILCIN